MLPPRLLVGVGVGLLVGLASSGCGGSSTPTAAPSPSQSSAGFDAAVQPGNSGVRGIVRGYGGPLVPSPTPHMAIDGGGMFGQKVTATAHGKVVGHTKTDKQGRFVLKLAAGSYQVRADCSSEKAVVVPRGQSVPVSLRCYFP